MNAIKEWFDSLQRREQSMLAVGAGALLIAIVFKALWSPLQEQLHELRQLNLRTSANLSWMLSESASIQRLGSRGTTVEGIESMSLSEILNTSTKALALPMSRLQPAESGEVQVWLDDIAFDKVTRWLYDMENRYGRTVVAVNINALETPGQVNAQIRFQ